MTNLTAWAVALSLLLGSIRALQLFRAAARVDAVNVVVLTILASGRAYDLASLLRGTGRALYLEVAYAITQPVEKLRVGDAREVRQRLERDAQLALMAASRKLRRFVWLDSLAVGALALAGVSAATGEPPTGPLALGLVAASLLWLSNVYGARSIATRMFAGAMALVDSLVAGLDEIRGASHEDR